MAREYITPIDQPAAGTDWSVKLSNSDEVKLLSLTGKLATSAVVATRSPVLTVTDLNGNVVTVDGELTGQAASLTITYSWRPGNLQYGVNAGGTVAATSCPGFWLPAGATIKVTTVALDVADQWSALVAYYMVKNEYAEEAWELAVQAAVANG